MHIFFEYYFYYYIILLSFCLLLFVHINILSFIKAGTHCNCDVAHFTLVRPTKLNFHKFDSDIYFWTFLTMHMYVKL